MGLQRVGHDCSNLTHTYYLLLLGGTVIKNSPTIEKLQRDVGLTPELRRSPRKGNGNPLQNSCLENSMGRGAWWAILHGDRVRHD